MLLKIIHVTASYKPAYIYGGPIMSVAKLCESLQEQGLSSEDQRIKSKDRRLQTDEKRKTENGKRRAINEKCIEIQVLTTTANGKVELDIDAGTTQIVEKVAVTYFKRWTKDHSHFSPPLLWSLCRRIQLTQRKRDKERGRNAKQGMSSTELEKSYSTLRPSSAITQIAEKAIIIHIHAWWNLVSILSCLVAKWHGVSVILSPRGMVTSYSFANRNSLSKKLIHRLIGKKLLSYCHIHATSEQEKIDIQRIIQPKSITVIPNLVSTGRYPITDNLSQLPGIKYKNDDSAFKLIFLSRVEEKKGLALLLESLALLNFSWNLTIAGAGEQSYVGSLKIKAESLKLSNRIDWIGQVNDQQKFQLMAEHDLLLLPSYNENFANVVIESLSVGTPVLISNQVGLSDYIKEKNLGWITGLSADQIKDNITAAFLDPGKRKLIRDTAAAIIINDFNDQPLVERYIDMYSKVLMDL